MTLGLNDLHASVGEILKARMWSLRIGPGARPEDAAARTVIGRRYRGIGWKILAAVPIGGLAGAGIALLAGGSGGDLVGAGIMTAYLSGIGTGVGSLLRAKFARNVMVTAEELRALSSGVDLPRAQEIYLETVAALLEAGENVSEQTGKEIVSSLNDLVAQSNEVVERLERLRKAASAESVDQLEAERNRLAERIEKVNDAQAREDLTRSLAICDDRLRNARALAPLVERLDAQREVVEQTLLSVQSAVSRLQVAPSAIAGPDVEEVKRVVNDVTAQTRAVEEAVHEVMTIHSS